jgi:hypothetical protein
MGFHKRFITKDLVLSQKSFEDIERLLNADALIFDSWSSNFFKRFDEKYIEYQDKRNLIREEHKFKSSWPDVSTLDGYYLSNILINLKLNPDWIDIQLCIESFRPIDIPQTISGKFDLLCNFCIQLIENKLEDNELQ